MFVYGRAASYVHTEFILYSYESSVHPLNPDTLLQNSNRFYLFICKALFLRETSIVLVKSAILEGATHSIGLNRPRSSQTIEFSFTSNAHNYLGMKMGKNITKYVFI